jgi:hypothetical protein
MQNQLGTPYGAEGTGPTMTQAPQNAGMTVGNAVGNAVPDLLSGIGKATPMATAALGDTIGGIGGALSGAGGGGGLMSALGGAGGGIMGGPASMIAGVAGDLLSGFAPELSSNTKGTSATSYDFGADLTAKGAAKKENRDGIADKITAPLEAIPVIGGFVKGAKGVYDMASSLFQPKASEEDKVQEYGGIFHKENTAKQAGKYKEAFSNTQIAAYGGYTDSVLGTGGPVMLEAGDDHENSEFGGSRIGPNALAEKGEVVAELSKGQFVFSNRF